MATIPKDVILIHTGANAAIPTGWTRETSLDGKFPKGWGDATAPNNTGGSVSHTHTSASHAHTLGTHTHTFTTSSNDWTVNKGNTGNTDQNAFNGSHYHTGTSGAASAGTTVGTAATYGTASSDPPNRAVIFIKSDGASALATNIVALWGASDTAPTNWDKVTELAGRYLKGAATGADADLTTDSGGTVNQHNITHTHDTTTHTHTAANTGFATGSVNGKESTGSGNLTDRNHTHSISMDAGTQAINQNTDTLTTAESVEPSYRRLHAIKKAAAGIKVVNMIGLWLGTTASIPVGWSLYTAMKDYHLKIGDPTTSATGGSNTHTHAAQSHSHTGGSHTHSGSGGNHPGTLNSSGTGQDVFTSSSASHTVTSDAGTGTYAAANTTADSSNNEPTYRTVAFIRFDYEVASSGGAFLYNLI